MLRSEVIPSFPLTRRTLLGAGAALAWARDGRAQGPATGHLRFGMVVLPTSCDPHFHALGANVGPLAQIYEALVFENELGVIEPQLAERWRTLNPTLWEFTLRRDVTFHDGTPFTAADVAASFDRVPKIRNSPGPFTSHLSGIVGVTATDPHTVHIATSAPAAFLLRQVSNIMIVRKEYADSPNADFNAGTAAIGTGPYRLSRFVPGEVFECAASDRWWGGRASWPAVTMRQIPAGSARTSALLAGDVDLIEQVPFANLDALRREQRLAVVASPPSTTHYIALDAVREETPFARGQGGVNPLRDARVRRALSISIDRPSLVQRMMGGSGDAAGQYAPSWTEGSDATIGVPPFDPAGARALLAEAGLENGLSLTLHGTSGWLPQDQVLLQAIVQFWRRIGVQAELETLPVSTFLPRATRREFSLVYGGTGGTYAAHHLRQLVMTRDVERGEGTVNRLLYSNPDVTAAVRQAYATLDLDARNGLLSRATRLAMEDAVQLPILFSSTLWAIRRDTLSFRPNGGLRTSAIYADPVRA